MYLKTHDFLKPLERGGSTSAKEEAAAQVEVSTAEKPAPPSVEHVLPGGIGTYSISHISYFNPTRAPKPEGEMFAVGQGSVSTHDKNDENSNCSSYSGSGFALWEESGAKKGGTGKENAGDSVLVRDGVGIVSPWTTSREMASNSATSNRRNSFNSRSSSQPLLGGQKNRSFVEMMKSANCGTQDDDFDDDEDFGVKKESSTTTTTHTDGGLRVKVDGKSSPDQKANTPRSKHSATEQRRRSKINDRFQMLREIIPNGDQKRDKASFLLEVVEYIQFLQEKVNKYEESHQGWSREPANLMPWRNNHITVESHAEQSQVVNTVPPTFPGNAQTQAESNINPATPFKAIAKVPGTTNQPTPFPVSLQPNFFSSPQSVSAAAQLPLRLASDAERNAYATNGIVVPSEKLKEQELSIEGGNISISSVYSQRLLNTLTKALQSCGVDLSKAGMSVQIELGKQTPSRPTALTSIHKDNDIAAINQGTIRSRVSCSENSDKALKKLKAGKS